MQAIVARRVVVSGGTARSDAALSRRAAHLRVGAQRGALLEHRLSLKLGVALLPIRDPRELLGRLDHRHHLGEVTGESTR